MKRRKTPIRLGLLTALWRRPALTEIVLRYYASLDERLAELGVELVRLAVRSPEDPEPTPDVPGWLYASCRNDHLARKFSLGMEALRRVHTNEGRLAGVVVVGSDDLVTVPYLHHVAGMMRPNGNREPAPYVSLSHFWVFDTPTGRCCRCDCTTVGAGRVLSADTLDRTALVNERPWRPWEITDGLGKTRGLDGAMTRVLSRMGVRPAVLPDIPGYALVDLKSDETNGGVNLWPFERLRSKIGTRDEDGPAWLRAHFPSVADDILALRDANG